MIKTVFIYALKCPVTGTPRYVGQTPDPKRRLSQHLSCKENYHCARWIQKLRSKNLVPVMEILDQSPSTEADFWETEYIRLYRALYPGLTNICAGGEGTKGLRGPKHTPTSRAKISAARKGKALSPQHRAAIGRAFAGIPKSSDSVAKLSASKFGKKTKSNTSGYVGVSWDREQNKWRAQLGARNEKRYVGGFTSLADAVFVRALAVACRL